MNAAAKKKPVTSVTPWKADRRAKVAKTVKSGKANRALEAARDTAVAPAVSSPLAAKKTAGTGRLTFMRVARPDAMDYRDRPYRPPVGKAPAPSLFPDKALPIKHQGDTNACTGFGLSVVVEHLLQAAGREEAPEISPYMLYSMARRYDEYPGSTEDEGSSLRGALKGWFKHGACAARFFDALDMPAASTAPEDDWWFDAVKRPLGAYYRIDAKNITDIHIALAETGVVYASAACHAGWDEGVDLTPLKKRPTSFDNIWAIPVRPGSAAHSGHAFALVGYNERGFLVQNSWGTDWGSHGYALLTYDDWLRNAMDCWVAQIGVVTQDHEAISRAITLRTGADGKVALAASDVLRDREIAPFILNLGNNGKLSNSGVFRTQPDDVRAIVDVHLAEARKRWKPKDGVVDVCIFAHGGLVGESAAATMAAQWIPLLYDQQVFPIFLMWETDFFSSLLYNLEDALRSIPSGAAVGTGLERWWNERLERLVSRPGSRLWGEMKQNADAMSLPVKGVGGKKVPDADQAGGVLLYEHFKASASQQKVRLHFVGHSAGSIVAASMIDRLVRLGMPFESVSFMAPAVSVPVFDKKLRPHLKAGQIKRYQQFHLSDRAEEDDRTCGPYRRSLLYLVSQSFEGGKATPILGMQKYFEKHCKGLPNSTAYVSPGPVSASTSHGGFDDDPGTRAQVLKFIRGK